MTEKNSKIISANNLLFLIPLALAVFILFARPFEGLSSMGHMVMGFTLITVGAWIFKPLDIPNSISGIFFLGSMVISGMAPSTVFSGFSLNALWTLIPALFFGLALQKTGLGERIATGILKLFPSNWLAVIGAWTLIGILLSLVTPSMTVRAVIMVPLATQSTRLYGLKPASREASLMIFITIFTAIFPGNAFLTGNLTAPIIQGIFDTTPGLEGTIVFDTWIQAALLPVAVITVVTIILAYFFLKPSEKLSREKFLSNVGQKTTISRNEIITAAVLIISCAMFFTGRYHGISNIAICIMAAVILFAGGVLSADDFSKGISWDLVFFFGSGLCMSSVFQASGLSDWLAEVISPLAVRLTVSPYLFAGGILSILFVWRFVDITTLIPTTVILAPVVSRIYQEQGISPAVWGVIFAVASISMFLTYTNMWTAMGRSMVKEYAWKESDMLRFGIAFFLASLAGILVCVPYWTANGLL